MNIFSVNTGESAIVNVPVPAPLLGLTTVVQLRMGQSNETSHTQFGYRTTIGGRWSGTTLETNLPQKNAMGYAQKKLQASHDLAFVWTKYAIGGQQLEAFLPGGEHHAVLLEREDLLWQEYGKIDLVTMVIGETNASSATTTAAMEADIYAFMEGLAQTPKAYMAVGPLNMFDVPNAQEEAIRQAYRNVETTMTSARQAAADANQPLPPAFLFVPWDTVEDDHLINNHHIEEEATADAASDLLVDGLTQLLGISS